MSDPRLPIARPGPPLRVKPETWNRLAQWANNTNRPTNAAASQTHRDAGIVMVRNDTGAALDKFGVVTLGDPVITPANNLEEFKRGPIFAANSPVEDETVAIVKQPLPTDFIGPAVVSGATLVKVDVKDDAHKRAQLIAGDSAKLETTEGPGLPILWRETGTSGVLWGLVDLASALPRGVTFAVILTQDGGQGGDSATKASWTYTADTLDGTELGTGLSPKNKRPSVGQVLKANFGTGYYDTNGDFVLAWANEVAEQAEC